jgi:hypothetical protein
MKNNEAVSTGYRGIGFSGLLAIVFITLKLIGVISWSWAWVLSPLWIPVAIILAVLIVWLLVFFIKTFVKIYKQDG